MKKITLLILLSVSLFGGNITFTKALAIPSVKEFTGYTGLDQKKHLQKALKLKSWQKANEYFLSKRIKVTFGPITKETIPYGKVIMYLKEASKSGSILAMFQGYRLSTLATNRIGEYASKDVGYFSKQLMERGVCLGYSETAFGYSRGWYGKRYDWVSANKIMNAAKTICSNKKLDKWILINYNKQAAEYKIMSKRVQK